MYTYRTWQQSDYPWLERAAAADAWESLSPADQISVAPAQVAQIAATQLREVLQNPWGTAVVAMAGREPVGFILIVVGPDATTEEPQGYILTAWVSQPHRRQGVGRALLTHAEQLFDQLGLRKVKVWTTLHNRAARQLAERAGYLSEGLIGMKLLQG